MTHPEREREFRARVCDQVNQYFGYTPRPNIEVGAAGEVTYRINHELIATLACVRTAGLARQYMTHPFLALLEPAAVAARRNNLPQVVATLREQQARRKQQTSRERRAELGLVLIKVA